MVILRAKDHVQPTIAHFYTTMSFTWRKNGDLTSTREQEMKEE
jgi:hypothetical protein